MDLAIRSILSQSFKNFELLIIDDGSVDNSREIMLKFSRQDSRVKLIVQQHGGIIRALNRGCSIAQGEYIARLDCDDQAKPWRLEMQLAHLRENPDTVLLGGGTEFVDAEGKVMCRIKWPSWEAGLRDYLLVDCCIAHTTVMFRRQGFLELGGYRPHFEAAEDYDLFLRFAEHYIVDNLPSLICQYRLHGSQVSLTNTEQQVVSGIGAKLAAKARRAGLSEPTWRGDRVEREDLLRLGVAAERIDSLIDQYSLSDQAVSSGWRWSKLGFCS